MKKRNRDSEKFDVLDLFAEMAAKHGYDLTDSLAVDDFVADVRRSVEDCKKSGTAIFGKKTEILFAYVAGALGKAKLIKQEDSGDLFYSGDDVVAPDYRLTLENNEQLLVEVKNWHSKGASRKYSISKKYYKKLKQYSDTNGLELRFAIYFSLGNLWVLLSIDSFDVNCNSYTIELDRALACSEMARLGDCLIGTTPNLELHLLTYPDRATELDEAGQATFVISDVKIYCAGAEIINSEEKNIAFYLIQFGTWIEKSAEAVIHDNKLLGVKFTYSPEHKSEQNFSIIGHLSTMVTNGFKYMTAKNGNIASLKIRADPSALSVLIPKNYRGQQLPLWRFSIQPNKDFGRNAESIADIEH